MSMATVDFGCSQIVGHMETQLARRYSENLLRASSLGSREFTDPSRDFLQVVQVCRWLVPSGSQQQLPVTQVSPNIGRSQA